MRRRPIVRMGVLAALTLAAGCCIPVSPPSSTPTPPPPAPSPAITPAAPVPAPPSGVPSASAANPRWSLRPDSRLEERAAANVVPQIPDARAEFSAITDGPSVDTLRGGVVLCDIGLPGTPWFKSRPDIRARITFGDADSIVADGRNNRDAVTLSAPLPSLSKGQALRVEVLDRDLFNKDDFIDSAQGTFAGHFPMLMAGVAGKLQVTCRHLDRDWVVARLGPATKQAASTSDARDAACEGGLDEAALDFGFPWDRHRDADGAIDAVAALVGWEDAAVQELRERRREQLERWTTQATGRVEQMRVAALAPSATLSLPDSVTVGPFARHCGDAAKTALAGTDAGGQAAPRCVLEIAMTGVESVGPDIGAHRVDIVFTDGHTERLVLVAPGDGRGFFAADALAPALGRDPLQDAILVRVTDGSEAEFVAMP